MSQFKNALCLAPLPDYHWEAKPWALMCHRRRHHSGRHRVCFRDGAIKEWAEGDKETVLTKEARGG